MFTLDGYHLWQAERPKSSGELRAIDDMMGELAARAASRASSRRRLAASGRRSLRRFAALLGAAPAIRTERRAGARLDLGRRGPAPSLRLHGGGR